MRAKSREKMCLFIPWQNRLPCGFFFTIKPRPFLFSGKSVFFFLVDFLFVLFGGSFLFLFFTMLMIVPRRTMKSVTKLTATETVHMFLSRLFCWCLFGNCIVKWILVVFRLLVSPCPFPYFFFLANFFVHLHHRLSTPLNPSRAIPRRFFFSGSLGYFRFILKERFVGWAPLFYLFIYLFIFFKIEKDECQCVYPVCV